MRCIQRMVVMLVTAMLLMMLCLPLHALAADGEPPASPDSVGLIQSYSAVLSSGNKRVLLDAAVIANDIMAKIGFKNIKIQQSTSSTGSWSSYFEPSDQMAENKKSHSLDDFLISVPGGYYYRVQLTFYAKETGWFFPDSQSVTVTSNVVYVA